MNWEGRWELNSLPSDRTETRCDGTPDIGPSILHFDLSSEPMKKKHKNIHYGFKAINSWTIMHHRWFWGFIMDSRFWFWSFKLVTLAVKGSRWPQSPAWDRSTGNHHKWGKPQASIYLFFLRVKCQIFLKAKEQRCVREVTAQGCWIWNKPIYLRGDGWNQHITAVRGQQDPWLLNHRNWRFITSNSIILQTENH